MTAQPPTNSGDDGVSAGRAAPELVPEFWPPADPIEPVKARRIHWLLAIPFAIPAVLFPKRLGPHAAVSSWAAAYAVHFFWVLTGCGTVFAFGLESQFGMVDEGDARSLLLVNPLVELRSAWAGLVMFFFSVLNTWTEVFIAATVLIVIEAAFWVGGLVLIPLYAAGDGARRTYLRSVKLLLWASAFPALFAWSFPRIVACFQSSDDAWVGVGAAAFGVWQLLIIFRLGARYAGPRAGPRWRARQPRCEGCGYSLVSLPVVGRCPECGKPVSESLPAHRQPPAFATARGLRGRLSGFATTTLAALRARRFAANVAIWSEHRAARRYALTVAASIGVIPALALIAVIFIDDGGFMARIWNMDARSLWWLNTVIPTILLVGLGAFSTALAWPLIAGLFASRFGFRDMGDRVVVVFYSTAWLFVPLLLGIGGWWAIIVIEQTWRPHGSFYIHLFGSISYEAVVNTLCLAPAAIALVLTLAQLRAMLRGTRYANA